MAGTFSQVYLQFVFAVKHRESLLQNLWRDDIFKYMSGIIANKNQKALIVNGVENHVHLFVGIKPSICMSDLVRDVKNNSTNFINQQGFTSHKFEWQEGFGAFSYGHSQLDRVYKYILNQEKHHKKRSFKEEIMII